MKNLLDFYINFLNEATKWKEKVVSGELSPQSIRKLKKAGIVKPEREYYKGFVKGTKELLRKTGASIKYSERAPGPATLPSLKKPGGSPTIYIPKRSNVLFKTIMKKSLKLPEKHIPSFLRISKRHEADEAALLKKLQKRYGSSYYPFVNIISKKGMITGHFGPEILKKEKPYATLLSKLYKDPGARVLLKGRARMGEYETLEKIKKRQLRKARERAAKEKEKEVRRERANLVSLLRQNLISKQSYRDKLRELRAGLANVVSQLKLKKEE